MIHERQRTVASLTAVALIALVTGCPNVTDRETGLGGIGGSAGHTGGTAGTGGTSGSGGVMRTFEEAVDGYCTRVRECDPDSSFFPNCFESLWAFEEELWGVCRPVVDAFLLCSETATCEEVLLPAVSDPCVGPFIDPCLARLLL